ncbi:OLC1v1013380C1 [Oldenlandia corymbosa var. corymbosa]|nr:OLC1v1013380C1 [Oldenlandia corymbosa var. corymbosa]
MANLKIKTLVLFLGILIMSFSGGTHAEISCDTVYNDLYPCLGYVMGNSKVDPACCSGIKAVIAEAKTKNDRQSVCSCLKPLASSASDDQIKRASQVPKQCGINFPIVISRNVDCSK